MAAYNSVMRILLLIVALIVCLNTQGSSGDSQSTVPGDDPDLLLLEEYIEIGMEWLNSDLDSADHYANLALNLSKLNNSHHLLEIHRLYLFIYYYRGDYVNSVRTAHILRELTDEENAESLSAAFNNLRLMHMISENYDLARSYYDSALYILPHDEQNFQGRLDLYNNIGILENSRGNIQGAIEKTFEALELFDPKEDPSNAASLYQNLSAYYLSIEDIDNALKYAHLAVKIKTDFKMENTLGTTLGTLGDIYLESGRLDSAETYYLLALSNYRQL